MIVSVYFNLHRKLFSIRAEEGPMKGRVIGHARGVTLGEVQYRVNAAGQAMVRRTGRKNVHAFVRGEVRAVFGFSITSAGAKAMLSLPFFEQGGLIGVVHRQVAERIREAGTSIQYNPYLTDTFIKRYGHAPVRSARLVFLGLSDRGAVHYALGPSDAATPPKASNSCLNPEAVA